MAGIVEVFTFLLCGAVCFMACGLAEASVTKSNKTDMLIRTFVDIYEPSALVPMQGGVLIFEDEGDEMASMYQIGEDGSGLLLKKQYLGPIDININDIEGGATCDRGEVFVIGSHSLNKHGERSKKREQLLWLQINSKSKLSLVGSVGLWDDLTAGLQKIDPSMGGRIKDLNVEGLSCTGDSGALLIGLRNPLYDGQAILFMLKNPYDIFSKKTSPKFSTKPVLLDLGGTGVRSVTYHEGSGRFFLVSEVKGKKGKMRPRLWAWDGSRDHAPIRMNFPGLKKLENIEGMNFLKHEGKEYVIFVCDDGNKKKKQGAHYAIVETKWLKEKSK